MLKSTSLKASLVFAGLLSFATAPHAAETKAKADAKMAQDVGEARKDAVDDKRDAAYKAAVERCDAMSGDAKANCVANAKAQHGKS